MCQSPNLVIDNMSNHSKNHMKTFNSKLCLCAKLSQSDVACLTPFTSQLPKPQNVIIHVGCSDVFLF